MKRKGCGGLSKFHGVLEVRRYTPNASKENSPCQKAEPQDSDKTDRLA